MGYEYPGEAGGCKGAGGAPAGAGDAPEEGGGWVGSLLLFCTPLWCAPVPCNNLTIAWEVAVRPETAVQCWREISGPA